MPGAFALEGTRKLEDQVVSVPRPDNLHPHRQTSA
jgi:hypothetical protein